MSQQTKTEIQSVALRAALWLFGVVIVPILLLINLTQGHFGYADGDGCACSVSYTTATSNVACEPLREQCDVDWIAWASRPLRLLAYVDVTP